jgi:hypothetical protein
METPRNPVLSESDAFRLTVALVALALASALIGWLSEPLIGTIVFLVLAFVAFCAYLLSPEPHRRRPLRAAASEPHPHGSPGRRRVLVVANDALAGEHLRERIAGADDVEVEVDVLAPVLSSRIHLAVSDIDEERREAYERLERSLAWARSQGFRARGEIGDPSPATAMEDELRAFGADQVIVVTASAAVEDRQEREQLQRLRAELEIPVLHVATAGR